MGDLRTDDKCPAKLSSTKFKTLIENAGIALHSSQNVGISVRKARWNVTLL